ncbi:hypothetical protein GM30_04835 [Trabulsiella odontotermitis]|nr:hypothetical protein GM30_04835 [Trabulsiella odontotermitis]
MPCIITGLSGFFGINKLIAGVVRQITFQNSHGTTPPAAGIPVAAGGEKGKGLVSSNFDTVVPGMTTQAVPFTVVVAIALQTVPVGLTYYR